MLPQIEPPKANPENLLTIVRDAYRGKVVLPEFQRSFVWAREDIEELVVSIMNGYFVGTFLLLDTPSDKPMFPFRTVEGLDEINPAAGHQPHATVRLVLDGQQRVTSLFYVLYEPPIPLRNAKNPYRFFFRIDQALDADPEDAIYGISEADRRRLAEMEKLVAEYRAIAFSLFRDASRFYSWLKEQTFLKTDNEKRLIEAFYHRFERFMVPVVALSAEAGKDNVVNIFERINRTGQSLSLFDLAVARLYLKGLKLREMWAGFVEQGRETAEVIRPEFLLKVIALWEGKEPRKGSLLDVIDRLDRKEFEQRWGLAAQFMLDAYRRVTATQGGYGALSPGWIPYSTLLVPLAALLYAICERKGGADAYSKLDQWYWGNVFAQRYDSAVDTKSYQDFKDVRSWIETGNAPAWLTNLGIEALNLNVDEPRSALYKGMMCLVVLEGAKDFIYGQPAVLKQCQDDHIFPRSKFGKAANVNSVLNRTLISSNPVKSDKRPSEFLPVILKQHGGDRKRLREALASHLITERAQQAMEQDDFDAFITARQAAFAERIREKLGRPQG